MRRRRVRIPNPSSSLTHVILAFLSSQSEAKATVTLGLGSFDLSTEDCDGSCDGGGDGTSINAVLVLRSKAGVSGGGDGGGAVRFRLSPPEELQEVCKVIGVHLLAIDCN